MARGLANHVRHVVTRWPARDASRPYASHHLVVSIKVKLDHTHHVGIGPAASPEGIRITHHGFRLSSRPFGPGYRVSLPPHERCCVVRDPGTVPRYFFPLTRPETRHAARIQKVQTRPKVHYTSSYMYGYRNFVSPEPVPTPNSSHSVKRVPWERPSVAIVGGFRWSPIHSPWTESKCGITTALSRIQPRRS